MSQSSFADPKTTYSLYCMGCFQFIWFQGLSSSSVSSVGPDLQGTQLVLLSSHLLPTDVEMSPPGPKTFGTQQFHSEVK